MTMAISRRLGVLLAIAALAVAGAGTAVYILRHQNTDFPAWIPLLGDDTFVIHAEFSTAQGVVPGQGQPVEIAGVIVGRVSAVHQRRGRAVLTLSLQPEHAKLFRNASALLRPRTLLKDMLVALSPGTPSAGAMREGATIPVASTLPDVNLDEILSSLDANTRDALVSLAQGAGEGLGGQDDRLSTAFRRLDPTTRKLRQINAALVVRRRELARAVTAFSRVSTVLGANRDALTRFVRSTDEVFASLAAEQDGVRGTLSQLPATLRETRRATRDVTPVLASLRSASTRLLGGARALKPASEALTPFFAATTPVVRDQLRPFAREVAAPLTLTRQATAGAADVATSSNRAFTAINRFLNELAYDPPGPAPSNAFWAAWAAHQLDSVVSAQDAVSPYLHTLLLTSCESLHILPNFVTNDPPLALAVKFANLPAEQDVCKSKAS